MRRYPARIFLSVPHMGGRERLFVDETFSSNWLSTVGPNLVELEKAFAERIGRPAVALSSGTAGIHLGLKLLGVGPGDEVVTPTLTFAASANPILYEKADPVLMDSEKRSWNLDPELLGTFLKKRARVNKLPKAVTVVHLFGQSAELASLLEICGRYDVPLLEDAANALGAFYEGRSVGAFGQVGVFSFSGNKIITGSAGGMLVADTPEGADRVRKWSTQSRDQDPDGINNYVHSELGYNYRMSNVVAGIVRGQLEVLGARVQARRAVFERYRSALADVPGIEAQPVAGPVSQHTRWLSCFLINEPAFGMSAADLVRFLDAANIESRPVWKPMHTQPLYRGYECIGGAVAEELHQGGICLPSSSSLSDDEQSFVISQIRLAHAGAVGKSIGND